MNQQQYIKMGYVRMDFKFEMLHTGYHSSKKMSHQHHLATVAVLLFNWVLREQSMVHTIQSRPS
jgi:hypothetical protein